MKELEVYSDGAAEEHILQLLIQGKSDEEIVEEVPDSSVFHTFSTARTNILSWYPFREGSTVLEVGAGMGAVTGMLCRQCARVVSIEPSPLRAEICRLRHQKCTNLTVVPATLDSLDSDELFDYVVVVGVLEYAAIGSASPSPYVDMLMSLRARLKPDGILLLAIENRFGLKYWCGAQEDHTGKPFEGIDGYRRGAKAGAYETPGVATFDRESLSDFLRYAGFSALRYYYPMPDYEFPTAVFSDERLPADEDIRRIKFSYSGNAILVADERELYKDVIKNGVFPFFANSYLVEASLQELTGEHIVYASMKRDYSDGNSVITRITDQKHVQVLPASDMAQEHIDTIYDNYCELRARGVPIVAVNRNGSALDIEYYSSELAVDVYQRALLAGDAAKCRQMLDEIKALILRSSELAAGGNTIAEALGCTETDMGPVLRHGFVDLTVANCIVSQEGLVCFDQEWREENIPLSYILYRSVHRNYAYHPSLNEQQFLEYVGIDEALSAVYGRYEAQWLETLMNSQNLKHFDPMMYHEDITLENKLSWCSGEIERVNAELTKVGTWGQRTDRELNETREQLSQKNKELDEMREEMSQIIGELGKTREQLSQKSEELGKAREQLSQKNEELSMTWKQLSQKNEELVEALNAAREQLAQANGELSRMREELGRAQDQSRKNDGCEELQRQLNLLSAELDRIHNSRSWRMMTHVWRVRDKVIPVGSRRRRVLKLSMRAVRHPLKAIRAFSPKRLKMLIDEIRRGDWATIETQINKRVGMEKITAAPPEILTLDLPAQENYVPEIPAQENAEQKNAEQERQYPVLTVPAADKPLVSIIIPVYNQFEYTYLCIKSIILNSGDVPYEIIVADDCSTDTTTRIQEIISGVHVARTEKNLRFLLNCNHAAKQARGHYILFLNNDTQVQKGWLRPLVDLIGSDARIGMVGSKLIYPDGRLQEAGGILWRDGSAWNYGNGQNPALPEFNYVKDVDYISGAAIMIRRELWESIGGFDERFAPAYCEDSDLAFAVRKAGYRVLYQPKSVVVHFEGVSNGTDTSSGLKAYQVENQKKFFEKWKHVLAAHEENGVNVFKARDRSLGKKTVLFVDHYVPTYDMDAGSRTVFAYLKMLVQQGFNVKFIGDNFYQSEPYTTTLQQMGIEVLYGSWYAQNWKEWILRNSDHIDYAFLNRPHIAVNYIDFLRTHTKAKIVYYGHDLHFLRMTREYELTGDKKLLKEAADWKERELSLMRKADMAYYPSEVEVKVIHEIDPQIRVKAIPAYLFDDVEDVDYRAGEREGLFFIGGFRHGPNVDAVKWLASEIMPLLRERIPEIEIHIAGSCAPEELKALEGNGIKLEGAVSDEELARLYKHCRLTVVPLRYGAGIKGKVIESMRFGLPVVTTPCGAEGILNAEDCLTVVESAAEMAGRIAALYEDEEKLASLSRTGISYVREHFTQKNAVRALDDEFHFATENSERKCG